MGWILVSHQPSGFGQCVPAVHTVRESRTVGVRVRQFTPAAGELGDSMTPPVGVMDCCMPAVARCHGGCLQCPAPSANCGRSTSENVVGTAIESGNTPAHTPTASDREPRTASHIHAHAPKFYRLAAAHDPSRHRVHCPRFADSCRQIENGAATPSAWWRQDGRRATSCLHIANINRPAFWMQRCFCAL